MILGVILLFFGTSIIPCINGDDNSGYQGYGSVSNDTVLDVKYIYNITKALSDIIFTEYDEENGEIARGRAFGTKGEHKAAEILYENLTALGLYTWKEKIENLPSCPDVASKYEVMEYKMVITNKSSNISENVDCYIAPTWRGPRDNPAQVDYNFSYKGLKIMEKQKYSLPIRFDERCFDEDFVFITEDDAFNPNITYPVKRFLGRFFSPYSDPVLFWSSIRRITEMKRWYKQLPHCKAFIRYDFTDITFNMGNSVDWHLPVIFINGTVGKKILADIDNFTVDFHLSQRFNESVTSYNVIGQLNGTYPSKTVIVDSLYDGWWCQATADSAIGMAMVLGIAKYFVENNITPKYNIKFIGFGGEEHGFRGAVYYEAAHKDENVIYVIDLNQLGFRQDHPRLSLDLIVNNRRFMREIWSIAEESDYVERNNNTCDLGKIWMPRGAPSNDQPFARNRRNCKTVCFLKGVDWVLHHRDGINHTEGDVLKYFDGVDVAVTGEIVLNVVKHVTVDK